MFLGQRYREIRTSRTINGGEEDVEKKQARKEFEMKVSKVVLRETELELRGSRVVSG